VIEYTFDFWYELKQYLVLERYIQARMELVDVYSKLVDVSLAHLEYPRPDDGVDTDAHKLFDGDLVAEERFREFRHHIGDTLKDACEVMGLTECLTKVLDAIKVWMQKYATQATATSVPHWQELEAPIFSMRALGRMVEKDENIVLPQLMPLLVQIPAHEKLRFATIMVLGRYTEWTAAHPELLEAQFNYIVSSFQINSKEVVQAAAMAIKYFCTDCKHLLGAQVLQLQQLYDQILDNLPDNASQEEITEGVASVVAVQPKSEMYRLLKIYCDPLMQRLVTKASNASTKEGRLAVADHLQLITLFVQIVVVSPPVEQGEEDPAVKYWGECFSVLENLVDTFISCSPICERICRCWRFMVISHRTAMTPLLPAMANKLASAFETSTQGCFLWVTGAILREFSDDRDLVDQSITDSIYAFFETQATNTLRVLNNLPPQDLPDVNEDFFRLLTDALLYYPQKLIPSRLFTPILEAAISSLVLEQREPLSAALHFIRDVLSWAGTNPPSSFDHIPPALAEQLRNTVRQMVLAHGDTLVKRVLAGMMITFPRDCFADGSGALLTLFQIIPDQTTTWVDQTIRLLPQGTVTPVEIDRLMAKIRDRLQSADAGDTRQIRSILQDFTNTYRRRNVAPRDGLGLLEADRFRFAG
jgi:transportin-3